jgi:hypothetical protein
MKENWNMVARETAAFLRGRLYGAHDGAGVQQPEDADTSGGGISPSPSLRQAWEFVQEALEQAQHEAEGRQPEVVGYHLDPDRRTFSLIVAAGAEDTDPAVFLSISAGVQRK